MRASAATSAMALLSSTGLLALIMALHAAVLSINHRMSLPRRALSNNVATNGPASGSPWPM
eukprot:1761786-Heterocapsa_arctica.AAC.1